MIESTRNTRVVKATRLKQAKHRKETGDMLLEGRNVVGGALDAGLAITILFATKKDELTRRAQQAGVEVALVSEPVMQKLADTQQPQGPVAVARIPDHGEPAPQDSIVLCGISDPGNAGTLIRSAAAFGFQVVATSETVDLWSPKVLRSAAGAHFATPVVTRSTPQAVAAAGVDLVALVPREDDSPDPEQGAGPLGLMVGNEAHGLSPKLAALASYTLTVPTTGAVESLNAAVAGSIAMFAIAQGRP